MFVFKTYVFFICAPRTAEIGPHPRFIRKKHNLVHKRTVTADDAIAGFSFSLLHLDRRRINITAGPGQVTPPVSSLVVPGEGFPLYEQPLVKGDLIVIFVVEGDVLSGRPLSSLALDGMHIPEGNPQRRLCDAPSSVDALMKQLEAHEETSDERVLAARTASAQVIQAAWRRWRGRPGADDCDATCDLEPEPEPEPDPS
jgi:DnaJ-class molecular chaperone